jgi:hypothetical protein
MLGKATNAVPRPGLPDGIFSNQKYQFWHTLESLGIENVGMFYVRLEYLTYIWYMYIMTTFCGPFVYFLLFGMLKQ